MSTAANKQLVIRFFLDAMNGQNYDLMDGMFAPGYTLNGMKLPTAKTKEWAQGLRKANPNMKFHLQKVIAEGDTVGVWWILTDLNTAATITPTFGGVPIHGSDGGNPPVWSGINMLTFDGQGRVLSNWEGEMNPEVIPQPTDDFEVSGGGEATYGAEA